MEKKDKLRKEEQKTIHEKLAPKKWDFKKTLQFGARLVLIAVLFGCIAGAVVAVAERFLIKNWGMKRPSQTVSAKPAPTNKTDGKTTPVPTGTQNAQEGTTPGIKEPHITVGIADGSGPGEELGENKDLQAIQEYYAGIVTLARKAEKSLVRIQVILEGVDWFEEPYEIKKNVTGLYVGKKEEELLFLVGLDGIGDAAKFEVTLKEGLAAVGTLYSYDTNYRIAVISVEASETEKLEKEELPVRAVFSSKQLEAGTPVLILGNVNQHTDAMEVGMITSADGQVHIMDDVVSYFTTNVVKYTESEGFVFDMDGNPLGMLSATLCNKETGICSAASLKGLHSQVERILNKKPRTCCGVRIETVGELEKEKYGVSGGVYVTETITGTPAFFAGISVGDIIVKVGNTSINSVEGFYKAINAISVDKNYIVTVNREQLGERTQVELSVMPEKREY